MPRFNFTNITGKSRISIADIMNNFNKIETLGITSTEVNTLITNTVSALNSQIGNKQDTIGIGVDAPTSETTGSVYIQYFETEE